MPGVLKEFNYVMNAANSMICPKGDFTADQIPDLSGRIAIVTGMSPTHYRFVLRRHSL